MLIDIAELFRTAQEGQPRPTGIRRNAMMQDEIAELQPKVPVTTKATRPFGFDPPAAPGEETQRKITIPATTEFVIQEFLTPLATNKY